MREARTQLSMYVPLDAARDLESVRRVVDPVQSSLIPVHLTLCREDELDDLASIRARLRTAPFGPLTLRFGKPVSSLGHGVFLVCIEGEDRFRALRKYVLASSRVREQKPHITLAHPRNPRYRGDALNVASTLPDASEITFPSVSLIEQDGNLPWRVVETYELRGLRIEPADGSEWLV
jgi:hypothetical protein